MERLRIYIDTSVVGGCLDEEFSEESNALLESARLGNITFIVSDLLVNEIIDAPREVQGVFDAFLAAKPVSAIMNKEAVGLQAEYLAAHVVGPASSEDAHHVAIASVWRADVIASWNFKHLVHVEKIRGFNAVNQRLSYPSIDIRSPREIV